MAYWMVFFPLLTFSGLPPPNIICMPPMMIMMATIGMEIVKSTERILLITQFISWHPSGLGRVMELLSVPMSANAKRVVKKLVRIA